ncbi:hypothetical protein HDU86_007766 [Geranomyces michiganensis]|nr:hypothetical protein HDU86_007766 [Geranomyces michiganensis]
MTVLRAATSTFFRARYLRAAAHRRRCLICARRRLLALCITATAATFFVLESTNIAVWHKPPIILLPAIQAACAKPVLEGLYLRCEMVPGGLANLRNSIHSCVALALGASANIILPRPPARGKNKTLDAWGDGVSLSSYFDLDTLRRNMAHYCQMDIVETKNEAAMTITRPRLETQHPGEFKNTTRRLVENITFTRANPVVISFDTLFRYDFRNEPALLKDLFAV